MKIATLIPTQTAAADITSAGFQLGDLQNFSIQVDFTGSNVAGTLTLEASNNETGTSTTYVTVTGSSQSVTSSADHIWSVSGATYRWVRVFWDYSSGTGNITATLVAKETVVKPT